MKPRKLTMRPEKHFGRFMTLCIAAMCVSERKIVALNDFMLSDRWYSINARAVKRSPVGHSGQWITLFAGDPSHAKLIASRVNLILSSKGHPPEIYDTMAIAFEESYQFFRKIEIEGVVLSSYGMTRDQFVKDGLAAFGETEFSRILRLVEETNLDTVCLVAGFDQNDPPTISPHVFSVNHPGTAHLHDAEAFHAIGCGSVLANAALFNTFDPLLPLTDIIYLLLDAKFRSEGVPGVGKRTQVFVLGDDGTSQIIPPDKIDAVRELWEAKNKPWVPPQSAELINSLLVNQP